MKRFTLVLDDSMFEEFLRCFPDHGNRTAVLRKVIHKLIKREKLRASADEADEIVAEVFKDVESMERRIKWGEG